LAGTPAHEAALDRCSSQSLRNWSRQVDVDEGKADCLTWDEREDLVRPVDRGRHVVYLPTGDS